MRYFSILSLLLFAACGSQSPAPLDQNAVAASDESIPVAVAAVALRNAAMPIHASGALGSSSEQRLSFKTGGIIQRIFVKEGDVVKAGQLLAILDKTEIEAQVAQAEQGLAKAERDLQRVQALYRDSSATLELLQNATTGRDIAKEGARIAAFNRQYSKIRATKSGTIVKKLGNEGEMTGPGMPILVLFETGPGDWIVKVDLSDRDWARLSKGQSADVRFDAYPETLFKGILSQLPASADPANGLYPVEIKVQPQGKRFAPGLFAQVDIQPRTSGAYPVVPVEALVEGEGKSAFVFEVAPDRQSVKKTPVKVAFLTGAEAVLAAGPAAGSFVVTAGAPYLNEKKKITIIGQ